MNYNEYEAKKSKNSNEESQCKKQLKNKFTHHAKKRNTKIVLKI